MHIKSKMFHIELLRVIAVFCVLYDHSGEYGCLYYDKTSNIFFQYILFAMSILCKMAVPIFFMVSGALLLKKEETIVDIFRKRIVKYGCILLVFSFIQYIYKIIEYKGEFDWERFIKEFYSGTVVIPYWFLYSYLGFLLMLPLLQKMVKNITSIGFIYLLGLNVFFMGFLPLFEFKMGRGRFVLNLGLVLASSTPIFYSFMGYFIENIIEKKYFTKKFLIIFSMISAVFLVSSCMIKKNFYYSNLENKETLMLNLSTVFLSVFCCYIFYIIKYLFQKKEIKKISKKVITEIASSSLIIYLLGEIVKIELVQIFENVGINFQSFSMSCMLMIMAIISSYFIFKILVKIPIINKLV